VILEFAGQIKYRVAGRIKSGEQLIHHNDNFGRFPVLERVDDLFVVFAFAAILFHHPFPEPLDSQNVFLIQVFLAFALVWG